MAAEARVRADDLRALVRRVLVAGGMRPADAEPTILAETATTALMDARAAWDQIAATRAMELAADRARRQQLGAVVVRNSSSVGALGYYPLIAVRRGQIGLAITKRWPTSSWRSTRPPSCRPAS